MTKDETIEKLWEQSNHGTQREDIEAAYNAGAAAENIACADIVDSWARTWDCPAAVDAADEIRRRHNTLDQGPGGS